MRILVLSPYLPHSNVGHGGGTAVRGLVASLARTHEVHLFSLLRPGEADHVDDVAELGVSVTAVPFRDRRSRGRSRAGLLSSRAGAAGRALVSGYPYYVTKYWSRQLARRVLAVADEFAPDAVQIEYLQLALLCRDLRRWRDERATGQSQPRPFLALNSHELGSLPRQRRARQTNNPLRKAALAAEAAAWRRLQVAASHWADATLCVTEQDRRLYAEQGGRNLVTVPLGVDTEAIVAQWRPTEPLRCLFVGSFGHGPNRSAAELLVSRIWPQVVQRYPQAQLVLVGRGSRNFLASLGLLNDDPHLRISAQGFVADLTPLFRECRLFVAPLCEGGGIKIKILEAMARGIPIVTTAIGAEGIVNDSDGAVTIGKPDVSFADTLVTVLADPESAARRADTARRIIEQRFSWLAISEKLVRLYTGGESATR